MDRRKDESPCKRPTTSLEKAYQSSGKEFGNLDTVIDYIWCRLSEKYIKLSKAFRNMDITIVPLLRHTK